ncbi:hypothetical protein NPIL_593503 [Nephila pilipes]|uniref:Uncharacterized protein n=1 Tax=Nephila pilipes TaxID=299642 RepID=A0A8X6UXU9_NEPPI|nr:hypothetical protein NPIL_593503 [Nephila pilipes]
MAIFRLFFIFLIFTTLLGANVQSGSQPVHHVKRAGGEHPHQKIKGPAGVGSVAKDAYKEGQQVVQNASPGFAGKLELLISGIVNEGKKHVLFFLLYSKKQKIKLLKQINDMKIFNNKVIMEGRNYGFGWRYHKRCWEFSRWCTWLKMLPKKDDRN